MVNKLFWIYLCITLINNGLTQSTPKIELRIVGGAATTIENYPYQVSLIYIDSHYCGGSLIHPQYVLTAAHCTNEMPTKALLIRAGSTYIDQGGVVRTVSQICQYPDYDPVNLVNDISVIKLDTPYTLTASIQLVGLPKQDQPVSENQNGVATGWGRLSSDGSIPLELQKVVIPTSSFEDCKSAHRGVISNTMFCAGYMTGGKDACQGDSGGPFVISGVLIGITSWGNGCAVPNNPGVYTRVSAFVNFINSTISSK